MEEFTAAENPTSSCDNPSKLSSSMEKKARPEKDSAINCPRCNSTNTKFCYYNNYSLSQPRYFCKTCRRYWTEGGSLRSVPVGGGSRKKKRGSAGLDQAYVAVSKKLPDLVVPPSSTAALYQNSRVHGQDLNLGFPPTSDFKTISDLIRAPNFDGDMNTTRGDVINSFMRVTDHDQVYSSALGQLMVPVPEFKIPSLNFSLDAMGGETYGANIHENSSGRVLFPFEDLKTTETTTDQDCHGEQSRDQNGDSNGFWNGMLGGGSW